MVKKIGNFRGNYDFLSNFYQLLNPVVYDGMEFWTVEHAYQAAKTEDMEDRRAIQHVESPTEAKELGKLVAQRPQWGTIKCDIMLELVIQKFYNNPHLMKRLLDTGRCELVEGNYWHDNFWGECSCTRCKELNGKSRN